MIDPRFTEFPRMLFKGDDACVVSDADAKAQKLAQGWKLKLLPGETLEENAGHVYGQDLGLGDLTVAKATPIIGACDDPAVLQGWLDAEAAGKKRQTVMDLMSARLDVLTAPK
jgi:hypothetical protein